MNKANIISQLGALFLAGLIAWPSHAATAPVGATAGSFKVSEAGAATYSIPIAVPPGIAGMQPSLSLTYSSQGGNGLLGMGWNLGGLSVIHRCPKTVVQDGTKGGINLDANDRYCLDGQRLVAITGAYGAANTEYRTERESYSRIISYGAQGTGPSYWEVWTKSGQVMEYGNSTNARIEAQGKTEVMLWALNKVQDTVGNYLTVTYTEDNASGQYYPARIDYTGNANTGKAPSNSIQFSYEARPDITPLYQAGSLMKNTVRMSKVQSYSAAALTREYRLAYLATSGAGQSYLQTITECASDGVCTPATSFQWSSATGTQPSFNGSGSGQWSGYNITETPLSSGTDNLTGDFNGDGKMDKQRYQQGAWQICLSSGLNFSCLPWAGPGGPEGYDVNLFGDFNGDGKTDIAYYAQNGNWKVCLSTGTGFSCSLWSGVYSATSVDPMLTGDFNGDGLTDIARYEQNGNWNICFSTGFSFSCMILAGTYGSTSLDHVLAADFDGDGRSDLARYEQNGNWKICLSRGNGFLCSIWSGPYGNNSADKVTLADFNGDGKTDIGWYAQNGNWLICLSTGNGFNCSTWSGIYGATSSANANVLADFNVDGRTDMARYEGSGVWNVCLSTGSSFSCSLVSGSYSSYTSVVNTAADYNGDGRPDFMSYDHDGLWKAALGSSDFPNLLTSITTGLTTTTAITYKPLTDNTVYTKDTGALYPYLDLQAPMYVVSRVTNSDGIGGNYAMDYSYVGAKAHLHGGGYLGFKQVTAHDPQTGIKSSSVYRQDYPYAGLPLTSEKCTDSGVLLNQATNTYTNTLLNPTASPVYHQSLLTMSVEQSYELNGALVTTVTTNSQYDAYGNPTQIVVSTGDGYSKTTNNTYDNTIDSTRWFLGRLKRSTVTSVTP